MADPGLMFAAYDPDLYYKQMQLQRAQAYAQALMEQGSSNPGNAPYAGLANAGKMIAGALLGNSTLKATGDLYNGIFGNSPSGPSTGSDSGQVSNSPQQTATLPDPTGGASAPQSASDIQDARLNSSSPNLDSSFSAAALSRGLSSIPGMSAPGASTGQQQPAPQAQAGSYGGQTIPGTRIPLIPGMDPSQALTFFTTNPQGYQATWAKNYEMTEAAKNIAAAYGYGTPEYQRQMALLNTKNSEYEIRPNATAMINGQPFTAPAGAPEGGQIVWGANGPQMHMLPGAQNTISGAAYAAEAPKAVLGAWQANNTAKSINPGLGETFATPGGGLPPVPSFGGQSAAAPAPTQSTYNAPPQSAARARPAMPPPQSSPNIGPAGATSIPGAEGISGVSNAPSGLAGGVPSAQLARSPQMLAWMKGPGTDMQTAAAQASETGIDSHYQLQTMRNELAQLGANGKPFLTPGAGANDRLAIAKWVNSALASAGMKPAFDPAQVAAGEASIKGGTRLGFALSKTLGSREAAQLVQQAIKANPGIQNTPQGNDVVMRSLDATAQRAVDRNNFMNAWVQKYGNTFNADTAFNQSHPIQAYVGLALAPEAHRVRLKANPQEAHLFDQVYGQGAAQLVLNSPW